MGREVNFVHGDCFSVNKIETDISNINVYFYDGEHSTESHRRALEDMYDFLSNELILLVDDWNWTSVRIGTQVAIKNINMEILYKKEYFTQDGVGDIVGWWNGWCVFVLRKKLV